MKGEKTIRNVALRVETRRAGGNAFVDGIIPYNAPSADLGGFVERIAPSAFRRTLKAGTEVFALWAHDEREVLGSSKSGTLKLEDRADGLHFSVQLPASASNRYETVARGDASGVSFGFITEDETWDHSTTPPTRTLTAARLLEVSVGVAFPAYPEAASSATLRSKDSPETDEERLALELELARIWANGEVYGH
jgi:HK97 family phage prohead protease